MADCINTDTQIFHFQSPLPSPGWGRKDVMEGDYGLFQDTEPLDDTVALDSSLEETQLENHDFDTEVIEDPDCIEDVRTQTICEHEKEVVLDSEDEANANPKFLEGANGLSNVNADRKVEGNKVDLQKRPRCSPFMQLKGFAEACDFSVASEQCGTGKTPPMMLESDPAYSRLNCIASEEPKDSSEANALDFVNHYLLLNNVCFSPRTKPRDPVRKKVSPPSRIKGCQTLAKQIKTRTSVGKGEPFEWADNDHCGGGDFSCKRIGATFDIGGSLQRPVIGPQKTGCVDSKEGGSSANKWSKKSINLHNEVTRSTSSNSRNAVNFPNERSRTEQVSEVNLENSLGQESDGCNTEINAPDMFDIGFSTQMAAEAMEALSYGTPIEDSVGNVVQFPQNFLVDSSTTVTKTKAHLGKSCLQNDAFSDIEGTARMSKSLARSGTSNSRSKQHSRQELDKESEKTKRRKLSRSLARGLKGEGTASQNECSDRQSLKPVNRRKRKEAKCKNDYKKCEYLGNSSIPFEKMLLGKQCKQKKSIACQTGHQSTGGDLEGTRDEPENRGDTMNNIVKSSIITYKRKRSIITYKRKRSGVVTKPNGLLSAEGEYTKLCCNNSKNSQGRHSAQETGCLMAGVEMETIDGPVNPEKRVSDIMKASSVITYRRKRNHLSAKQSEMLIAGGKRSKFCCNTSEVTRNNRLTQQVQNSLQVHSLGSSLKFISWNCPKGKRTLRKRPRRSNGGNNQSFSYMIFDEKDGYKRPYNKNLPKSSLLKELIRLSIQEHIPYFQRKETRKRRDMACVRVLFSQHLDDDIIKNQQKILVRLGMSIASSSVDATHFIADKFVRTRNMLETIALGKPVVTHMWLESCGQASCLIDEKNYILRDAKKEKEIGFSMPVSLARARQHPLLKGRRVLITPNTKPDKEMITSLVKAVHGQATAKGQISARRIPVGLLIISCEEDLAICLAFLDKGAAVYSSELLLNGIVTQKLDYERHRLFTNYAKRNC